MAIALNYKIDVILLKRPNKHFHWPTGDVTEVDQNLADLSNEIYIKSKNTSADAILIWDEELELPDTSIVENCLEQNIDVWHAGLKLGTSSHPDFIDFVSPIWMLNLDPDPQIEATSWRLSLRACLIRTDVLQQLGGPLPGFDSIDSAGLEMGLRYIRNGAFIHHCPQLLESCPKATPVSISIDDQLRFIASGFGKKWLYWAGILAVISKQSGLLKILKGIKKARSFWPDKRIEPYIHQSVKTIDQMSLDARVSVLIPTINRYSYLRTLLRQLRNQTVKPFEIIVIDQTPKNLRNRNLKEEFTDLPLCWLELDQAGQCISRNLGLQHSNGEYILFIDDDDEIPEDLIEKHLINLEKYDCNVSNGIANEVGIPQLPYDFTYIRMSNVFPTNNTLIKREVLVKVWLV